MTQQKFRFTPNTGKSAPALKRPSPRTDKAAIKRGFYQLRRDTRGFYFASDKTVYRFDSAIGGLVKVKGVSNG